MPELPEVEVVRRGLEKVLLEKTFASVSIHNESSFVGNPNEIVGQRVISLGRRGKLLQIHCSGGWTILVHLRMTGQLIYVPKSGAFREGGGHPSDGLVAKLPSSHTRVSLALKGGDRLYFNDQRKFGSLKLHPTEELEEEPFLKKLGPEPWDKTLDAMWLATLAKRKKNTSIKAFLLDQHHLAGLGNIYVDEALFLSSLFPEKKAGTLNKTQWKSLLKSIREVLERGIVFGGVSARDYVNAEGLKGKMQEQLFVYGRKGEPCKRCGAEIVKLSVAGRGTHVCEACQPQDE